MLMSAQVDHLQAVARAQHGLSGDYFTSDAIFREEMRVLFHGGWMCIGTSDDVPAPSSIYPVSIAGQDLLMVRDKAGRLRVFFNHCRHRGAILAEEPRRNCARIVCPYHSWSYDLDGRLRNTPHVGGAGVHTADEIQPDLLGLLEVPVGEWAGMVFANLDGKAESFDDFIAPIVERTGAYDMSLLHLGGEAPAVADANWKVVVENFVESYHLPWIHPQMNRHNPMEDHYQILGGDNYLGQGLLGLHFDDAAANRLPRFPNLRPEQMTSGENNYLYPNLMFGVLLEFFYAVILLPISPGRTLERAVMLVNGAEAATDPALADIRRQVVDRITSVNSEDMDIAHSVQRGRSSLAFDGGRFSPMQERTSQQFQQTYALKMLAGNGHPLPDVTLGWGEVHHPRVAEPA